MINYIYRLSIISIIFIAKLNANIVYVSETGSDEEGDGSVTNPFKTIQKGVDISIDMDTVYVSNGVYEGGILISNKSISLIGESREETKINQLTSSPQISIIDSQVDTTRVENFIIENGSSNNGGGIYSSGSTINANNVDFENNSSSNNGAAINSINSSIIVKNSAFNFNVSENLGGAIFVDPLTTCKIYNSSFDNNGAFWGGAIATVGGGKLLVEGCNISFNTATGNNPNPDFDYPTFGGGGGIYQEWSDSLEIYDSEITNNTAATGAGGGIAVYLSNDVTINNIVLSDNSSSGPPDYPSGGGGVAFYRVDNVLFENSIIANNVSNDNSGGGIFFGSESGQASIVVHATFNRLTLVNNSALSGGAIFCWSAILNLYNSTLVQNEASNSEWSGGGLASHYVTEPNIVNSLFYDNIPNSIHNGFQQTPVLVAYSLVQEDWAGEGNLIDIDPLFMDQENEDYRLKLDSPCIDAGTADLDDDGEEDVIEYAGHNPDMGAFESLHGPTGLQYITQDSMATLWWNPSTDPNFQYFVLEKSTDSLFIENIDTVYLTQPVFDDTNIDWGIPYYYRVASFIGFLTDYSEVISITIEWLSLTENNLAPNSYSLHQNYPNPFNPSTELHYDLPENAMVNITIYDMLGRVINNLVASEQLSGFKSVKWNATNNFGQPVSAGVYLYRIEAGDFTQTKKMLLLK